MRFSAAPAGRLSDRTIPWAIFGERPDVPDGLEDSALAGMNLAQIASTPGAPMFEPDSIFGFHMAGQDLSLDPEAPVVVFVHGFQYEPRRPVVARCKSDNPHRAIFHFDETPGGPGSVEEQARRITPWFARGMLDAGRGRPEECTGLAVGYSYASYGGSPDVFLPNCLERATRAAGIVRASSQPSEPYVNAYRDAEVAGYGLAAVLTQLRARLDYAGYRRRRIDILCHSLGARTVMSALALIAQRYPGDQTLARIDRVILLSAACYWGQAAYAMANITFSGARPRPQFYNFTSRHDDVLEHLGCRAMPACARAEAIEDLSLDGDLINLLDKGRTIGRDGRPPHSLYKFFGPEYDDWIDIPLDSPKIVRWGRSLGFQLNGLRRFSLGDHWIQYTHPGNWALYRAILHYREGWSVKDIQSDIANF